MRGSTVYDFKVRTFWTVPEDLTMLFHVLSVPLLGPENI